VESRAWNCLLTPKPANDPSFLPTSGKQAKNSKQNKPTAELNHHNLQQRDNRYTARINDIYSKPI
jgi:hypothetical protein